LSGEAVVAAWLEAAHDLGLRIIAPYLLVDENNGTEFECISLVKDFGSAQGTIVATRHSHSGPIQSVAQQQGRFCSFIDENAYAEYERKLFIGTLDDWGWFGEPSAAPNWYTGEAWTSK
jgi:hypothetical protein